VEEPRYLETVRATRALQLNLPDFPAFVKHFRLPEPNMLSPLPDLCAPGAKGRPRPIEEIVAPMQDVMEGAVRWALSPLSIPDRVLDARIALFNGAPNLSRLYSSRQADDLFVGIRPHMTFDRELIFPFTAADLEVWLQLQLQFASGVTFPVPQKTFTAAELAFLLALADAYKVSFVRSFLPRRIDPQPVRVTVADILEAQDAARQVRDRRWISTALGEFLGLIVHLGGRTQVGLPLVTQEFAQREIERYIDQEHLKPAKDGGFELGIELALLAGDLFTWLSIVSLHDLQIVGGTATAPEGWEELLMFITTSSTVWVLASEGLTVCEGDLGPARFALRSLGMIDALDVALEFLEPLPGVAVPVEFYASAPGYAQAAFCPACGVKVPPGRKFCGKCGAPQVPPPERTAAPNTCPACGAAVKPGRNFCGKCGSPLAPPSRG
jgi:hypothetical protein